MGGGDKINNRQEHVPLLMVATIKSQLHVCCNNNETIALGNGPMCFSPSLSL